MVPYPLGKGIFVWGNPIWVDPRASKADLEVRRCELEQELNQITFDADTAFQ